MRILSPKPENGDAAMAGFFLGEGHLDLVTLGRPKSSGCLYLRARIALRSDDKPVLDSFKDRFGGNLSYRAATRSWTWAITGNNRVGALLDLLEECPLPSKKMREIAIMRRAQLIIGSTSSDKGISPERAALMYQLRDQLKSERAFR
jgi:hypothetical protein